MAWFAGIRSSLQPLPLYAGLGLEFAWWYWFMGCVNNLDPVLVGWCPRPLTGLQGIAMLAITLLLGKRLHGDALQGRIDLPMSLALLVASLLVGLPLDPEGAATRCTVALILAGLGTAWCYIRWSGIYGLVSAQTTLVSAFSCFIVGTVLKTAMWVMPPVAGMICACCCAVALLPCAAWLARWTHGQQEQGEVPEPPPMLPDPRSRPRYLPAWWSSRWWRPWCPQPSW